MICSTQKMILFYTGSSTFCNLYRPLQMNAIPYPIYPIYKASIYNPSAPIWDSVNVHKAARELSYLKRSKPSCTVYARSLHELLAVVVVDIEHTLSIVQNSFSFSLIEVARRLKTLPSRAHLWNLQYSGKGSKFWSNIWMTSSIECTPSSIYFSKWKL